MRFDLDMSTRLLMAGLVVVVALAVPRYATAHTEGFELHSTADGGGELVASTELEGSLSLSLTFCSGGECLFENDETAVAAPSEGEPPLFAIEAGTSIRMELVSADTGASVRIEGANLNEPGESVAIGEAPALHGHPVWQIESDEGAVGEWHIAFRFTTTSAAYTASETVELVLTNGEPSTTTSTTVSSSTTITTSTTLLAPECGNGEIEAEEACDTGPEPWSDGRACTDTCEWLACGDPNGDGNASASDALFVLGAAVGLQTCDACVCNVDASSGGAPISSGDALRVLRAAVGLDALSLICTSCE
jgi:hypothetical protein